MSSTLSTSSPSVALSPVELFVAFCAAITLDNGLPFAVEAWQLEVVADLLSGVTEEHLWVPEGNGKTTLAAAVALFHLCSTPRPKVLVAAESKQQARTLYEQAIGMVYGSRYLERRLTVRESTLEIRPKRGPGNLKVIAGEDHRAHGTIPTLVILDEMQAHPGLGMYRTLAGKLPKRGGQLFSISTAGEPDSEFENLRSEVLARTAQSTTDGRHTRAVGPHHVIHNWALRPDDDVNDMAVVAMANPLVAVTEQVLAAKRSAPAWEEKHWRTFVCNLPTRDFVARFLPASEWTEAGVDEEIPEGEPITLGIDWGWIEDATAFVPLWRREDGVLVLGPARILEPPRNGTQLDPGLVEAALLELQERNPIIALAHDASPMGGGHLMTGWLAEHFPATDVLPVTPGDVADAAGHFLEQLRAGALKHTKDPTLTRHLLNAIRVAVTGVADKFRLGRSKESRHAPHQRAMREIDAAVAAVLAVWGTVGGEPVPEPFLLFL
jgi:hypothetical protein